MGYPKMDGENNGKPYEQMDDLGGFPPFFWFNTHMQWFSSVLFFLPKILLPWTTHGFEEFLPGHPGFEAWTKPLDKVFSRGRFVCFFSHEINLKEKNEVLLTIGFP